MRLRRSYRVRPPPRSFQKASSADGVRRQEFGEGADGEALVVDQLLEDAFKGAGCAAQVVEDDDAARSRSVNDVSFNL